MIRDAITALQQVLLIQSDVTRLSDNVCKVSDRLEGLTGAVAAVGERVSRLEGWLEGAQTVASRHSGSQPLQLPLEKKSA